MAEQRALVTGGSRGIGRAVAVALANRGARVAITYFGNSDGADETVRLCREAGAAEARAYQGDVGCRADVERAVSDLDAAWGGLDVVMNNAGYGQPGKLMDLTEEQWDRTFQTHVKGAFYVCRATVPLLRKSDAGVIINVGSVAGLRGLPGACVYGTVKGAVIQFTRCLAWELADENIRVNAICPGIVRTDFHAAMTEEAKQHNLKNRVPLHREGTPEDIAQMVLAMIDNTYLTGETVVVDGGLTMRIC